MLVVPVILMMPFVVLCHRLSNTPGKVQAKFLNVYKERKVTL